MPIPDQIKGKNILLRLDLDVPIKDGRVENTYRLKAVLPTIKLCLQYAHRTCLIGHLGRPEGQNPQFSLQPVKNELERLTNQSISFISSGFSPGDCWTGESPLALLENLRFDSREEKLDREFAQQLSKGANLYIYEAFATYRPCTSLSLIPEFLPTTTGLRFNQEVETLSKILNHPDHPTLLIASGAKTDKLEIINQISSKFDQILLGGKFAKPEHLTPDSLDINSIAIQDFQSAISKAKTIVLNGPLGYYEDGVHNQGTKTILQSLKDSSAFTVLGGGDTLATIPPLGFSYTDYGFVSTGGGAMLDFLTTGTHPLLEIIKNAKLNHG